ncbi:hypothetical protein [Flavobacterium hercynium]|uniref:Uncharacterized protein n=1 Tax=Flavobacterium hercynium TaxID=387094 RepID=A0A226HJG6_9FLAO|nr:hypothetical protein [Flavobacterium hercynium]OXA93806.1 hypothetical protein B0A66_06040 [Flavobacterium hercynium]SMP20344.1 hypothetical protein SAMN06265346_106159 [Flavobacterium hercynium]
MKKNTSQSLLSLINSIPVEKWDYYNGIDRFNNITNPFTESVSVFNHKNFIKRYFKRGGKIKVLKTTGVFVDQIRLPNHINSVFFLGILFYYNTDLHKKYKLENNDPGYSTFPFIWFLIALFHDNAYQMEMGNALQDVVSLDELKKHFQIDHFLLDINTVANCKPLQDSRADYFTYRKEVWKVADHGIVGGILLYDRLVKIRREKKLINEDNLFWGENLEKQYLLAACAISLHNIWLPQKGMEPVYEKYNLHQLISFQKIKFADFPLFYLLAIVDTIEPLKTYRDDKFSDQYILENLYFDFKSESVEVSYNEQSSLDFCKMKEKLKSFDNWINLDIKTSKNSFELIFK